VLIALDSHPSAEIELGELLTVVHVRAANVVKDIRENIRNLVGGRMGHYEGLIRSAVEGALCELDELARSKGYDGVIGYGNAFRIVKDNAKSNGQSKQ
jgi:uncharacterized protein YbjQ (UPF0145 family)